LHRVQTGDHSGVPSLRAVVQQLRRISQGGLLMRTLGTLLLTGMIASGCAVPTAMDQAAARIGVWSEAEVAGVVIAAHDGQIQQGNIAVERASSPQVRDFARMMANDHAAALQRSRELFDRRNIVPAENETVRTLRTGSQRTVETLASYSGAAFDRAYIRSQVEQHQWLLNTFDRALIPSARSADVRNLLDAQRTAVAQHLEQARTIQQEIR
jgi:putative membrane protein